MPFRLARPGKLIDGVKVAIAEAPSAGCTPLAERDSANLNLIPQQTPADPTSGSSPLRASLCIATCTPRAIARLFEPLGYPAAIDPDLAGRAVAIRGRELAGELVDRLLDLDGRAGVFEARATSNGCAPGNKKPRDLRGFSRSG